MRLPRLPRSTWETPVVSLALAVALWLYTSGQVRVERVVAVRISAADVSGLASGYEVTAIRPDEFRVELSVPSTRIGDLDAELRPRLAVRPDAVPLGANAGSLAFPIAGQVLGLPADVRIIATDPQQLAAITVDYDRRATAALPVEPPEVRGLPAGVRAVVRTDPTIVRVEAGSRIIAGLRADAARVRFQPIDLGALPPGVARTERIRLEPEAGAWRVMDEVHAAIELVPGEADRKLAAVPVRVLTPADFAERFDVQVTPSLVALTLHGPQGLIEAFDPERDLTAYVSLLRPVEPGVAQELPVRIAGPPWLSADPAAVQVRVTLAAGAASPVPPPGPEASGPPPAPPAP